MEMILSPAWIPASLAGEVVSLPAQGLALSSAFRLTGTHWVTAPIVVVFWIPIPMARPSSSTNASAKCMNEPAARTIARCQPGCRRNERGSSAGSTSSSEVIPTIFTNPPSGSALTPYSVSPRIRDQTVCPKPTKNCVTFMWNFLAVTK